MKKLYYVTFEKGYKDIVKLIIKKQDRNASIKILYEDSALFYSDEYFNARNSCFTNAFVVLHNSKKNGAGALNFEIKELLEKKDLKINFSKEAKSFRLTISKENENVLVDDKLKFALEVMLKKNTKKNLSYFSDTELVLLAKNDGENLFMKRLDLGSDFKKVTTKFGLKPETAYIMNFLSEASQGEVSLDTFSEKGIISYVRAVSFAKANTIATTANEEDAKDIRKLAKSLKDKAFSVLNYNFLDDEFPIRFIDKIVTNLAEFEYTSPDDIKKFFEKVYSLKVKILVINVPKILNVQKYFNNKFTIETEIQTRKDIIYKLKLVK